MKTKYNILISNKKAYKGLSEEEYFEIMEDLSILYYQTGSPKPSDIHTEMYKDYYSEE
jgi:hypothetical protein